MICDSGGLVGEVSRGTAQTGMIAILLGQQRVQLSVVRITLGL